MAWDNGATWQIAGNDSRNYAQGRAEPGQYDAATGRVLEIVDFVPNSSNPHGPVIHNGTLISGNAAIHPGWPDNDSPTSGRIFRIAFTCIAFI
jgi:hypothetical protein